MSECKFQAVRLQTPRTISHKGNEGRKRIFNMILNILMRSSNQGGYFKTKNNIQIVLS
jgi:hypothetical protein